MASSRIRRTLTAASAAAMLSMLAACSQAAAAAPQDDDTIVYAHQQEPQCLFGGWIEQAYISYQFLDNLFSLDENGEAVPWLAEDWSRSEDGLTYTIDLQSGVSFTDGTPVDAEAVAYNFDYWVAGGNSTAQVWLGGYYESAEAIDDLTVEVHLSRPYTRFIENLTQSYFGIQSQHALETRTDEENCRAPIGSGAFVVDEWNRGENVILTRNDDYTSPPANARHDGPAYVKTIDWRFIPEGITRVSALKAGEADAIYDIPAVEWADVDEGGYELHKYVTPGRPQQVSFNTTRAPFDEEDVRKAFILSLDRKKIVEAVGYGVIPYEGNGAISRATPGYDEGAAERYAFDPDEANALLDAAGWDERDEQGYRVRDGERLEAVFPYDAGTIINADGASIFQAVQEQARETGFKVDLIPVAASDTWSGAYSTPDSYDLKAGYWTSVNAGILYINWRQSTEENPNFANSAFYDDPELESIIEQANSAGDIDDQNALYGEAQEYIADHATSFGLYDRLSTLGVNPRLAGVWQEHAQGGPTFYDAHFVD